MGSLSWQLARRPTLVVKIKQEKGLTKGGDDLADDHEAQRHARADVHDGQKAVDDVRGVAENRRNVQIDSHGLTP